MQRKPYAALQRLLKAKRWEEALAQVDALLAANPLAAQLYLLQATELPLSPNRIREWMQQAARRAAGAGPEGRSGKDAGPQ
jgi:hypothetical protein